MELTPQQLRLYETFFPTDVAKRAEISTLNGRFVHYTTADAAVGIIRDKTIWMRKSAVMNDFMEIEHGMACLNEAYKGETGALFRSRLNEIFPNFTTDLENRFNSWLPTFRADTYLTSMSEHSPHEDKIGRLSMWRAYGGTTGIALVMRNTPFMGNSTALKAYSSAVQYLSAVMFEQELAKISDAISRESDLLNEAGYESVMNNVFSMMRFAVLCTKHPGFIEEREWRILYSPKFDPSEKITQGLEIVRGTPQMVQKIPLKSFPDEGLFGADIPSLLDHIIIGPTQYPTAVYEAFVSLLQAADVKDAESKVWTSSIPLRQ